MLGIGGGSSLARANFEKHDTAISSLDEDSDFTFIQTPEWMWRWCAAPPLEAWKVKHLLPFEVWESLSPPSEMVAPMYKRLAMGSSNSVHIIMQINLYTIGKALIDYAEKSKPQVAALTTMSPHYPSLRLSRIPIHNWNSSLRKS